MKKLYEKPDAQVIIFVSESNLANIISNDLVDPEGGDTPHVPIIY